jgi:choline dehydrogenase-like flavoprotein
MPKHYDILIVGAGSAGSVLAARLSEDPARRVALVEAGRWEDDPDIANPAAWGRLQGKPYDWAYRTVPQPGTANRVHDWPRGRLVGGSSCLHAMAHVRGHRSDFDAWGPGWTYDDLLPYFRRAERFTGPAAPEHGTDGPLTVHLPDEEFHPLARAFMAAGVAAGYAHSGDHAIRLDGPAPNSLTIRDGRRVSLADAYLRGVDRTNLDLLTGLLVDRILFDGTRATGVAATGPDGPVTLTADRIVLSAGTIATPLILMRSGIGPADDLRSHGIPVLLEQPEVGRNLHDHLLGAGNVYAARQPVAPSRTQHSESLMYLADTAGARPRLVVGAVMLPVASEVFPRREAGTGFTLLFGQTKPQSRGRLTLGGRDPAAAPVIDPAYLSAEEDRIAMRDALKAARTIAAQPPLDPWRGAEILPGSDVTTDADLDAFVARAAITHHHPAGTCRMGAVVDGELGVRGMEGLSIVDASVIPELPCGPINAAVVAMAERAAALLAPP